MRLSTLPSKLHLYSTAVLGQSITLEHSPREVVVVDVVVVRVVEDVVADEVVAVVLVEVVDVVLVEVVDVVVVVGFSMPPTVVAK